MNAAPVIDVLPGDLDFRKHLVVFRASLLHQLRELETIDQYVLPAAALRRQAVKYLVTRGVETVGSIRVRHDRHRGVRSVFVLEIGGKVVVATEDRAANVGHSLGDTAGRLGRGRGTFPEREPESLAHLQAR